MAAATDPHLINFCMHCGEAIQSDSEEIRLFCHCTDKILHIVHKACTFEYQNEHFCPVCLEPVRDISYEVFDAIRDHQIKKIELLARSIISPFIQAVALCQAVSSGYIDIYDRWIVLADPNLTQDDRGRILIAAVGGGQVDGKWILENILRSPDAVSSTDIGWALITVAARCDKKMIALFLGYSSPPFLRAVASAAYAVAKHLQIESVIHHFLKDDEINKTVVSQAIDEAQGADMNEESDELTRYISSIH
jgi:hypothetical protein